VRTGGHGHGRAAGIVLAAGASSRMGRMKQLLPVGGRPLVARVLTQALDSDLDHVALVVGHGAGAVRQAVGDLRLHPKLRIVENIRHERGISTSIKAGLTAVEQDHDLCMILLGDMPFVGSYLLNRFLRAFRESGRSLGAVTVGNRRSHPVVFTRALYPELHQLEGDRGARELFVRHQAQAFLFPADYDDRDIDTKAQYEAIRDGKGEQDSSPQSS